MTCFLWHIGILLIIYGDYCCLLILFSSRLKSLNFVSLRLNSEVFKAAQSKLSHILTIPINTSVERIGVGQACDSKRLQTTGRRSPSTRAGWSVPLLFTTMSVLKHFVDVHYYIVCIFVCFLLYFVYVFVLCSPYLEDNKVSIYLIFL